MAASAWTTDELLASIRAQGRLLDEDPDATDAILLAEATRQLYRVFVPAIRAARADYYLTSEDIPLVTGQVGYAIPARSSTSSVRKVMIVDSAGREDELDPIPVGDSHLYQGSNGQPCVYTIQDDRILLRPAPARADTLRVLYEYRPAELALRAACAQITAISRAPIFGVDNVLFEIDAKPAAFVAGFVLDAIRGGSPFSLRFTDAAIGAVSVSDDISWLESTDDYAEVNGADTAVGDFLCPAGTSCIPQIPVELHPALALATAAQYLLPTDPGLASTLKADALASLTDQLALLAPRQQGRQMKLRNQTSFMRRGARRRRGGFSDWTP